MTASISKWFVGSSNSSNVGWINNARASDTLILHPPEKSFVNFDCIAWVNPNPCKMDLARVSAVSASKSSNRSYVAVNISIISSCFSSNVILSSPSPPKLVSPRSAASVNAVIAVFKSSASFSNRARSSSTLITASNAVMVSLGSTSSFKWKVSIPPGMGIARAPNAFIKVDFPQPLRPIKP
mmetsp:Transcript_11677/g.16749  ORF Transcript_11677/g.16749 Transcript_11677/m.16749 type:complete len:182 (+) Transcript_11677:2850-3395(+)